VLVLTGPLDGIGGAQFLWYLRSLGIDCDVVLDIWDLSGCDSEGLAAIRKARQRVDTAGWRFAVVGDPNSPCGAALGASYRIPIFSTRRTARAALRATAP